MEILNKKYKQIADALHVSPGLVKKTLKKASSVPLPLRIKILNTAYRMGENWIEHSYPTHILILSTESYNAYSEALLREFSREYGDTSVRLLRSADRLNIAQEVSNICSDFPTCLLIVGAFSEVNVRALEKLSANMFFVFNSISERLKTLYIDQYVGVKKITAELIDKGLHVRLVIPHLMSEQFNDAVLGYLSNFPLVEFTQQTDYIYRGDKPLDFKPTAQDALIIYGYETAKKIHALYPETPIVCIGVFSEIPAQCDYPIATVLPEDIAAQFMDGIFKLSSGQTPQGCYLPLTVYRSKG